VGRGKGERLRKSGAANIVDAESPDSGFYCEIIVARRGKGKCRQSQKGRGTVNLRKICFEGAVAATVSQALGTLKAGGAVNCLRGNTRWERAVGNTKQVFMEFASRGRGRGPKKFELGKNPQRQSKQTRPLLGMGRLKTKLECLREKRSLLERAKKYSTITATCQGRSGKDWKEG